MRKLNKFLAPALLATLAAGAAVPAVAAPTPYRADAIRNQIAELQRRVERNDGRDRISEREARGLRQEVYRLRDQFRIYNRNGLNRFEYRTLTRRINDIRVRLRIERRDWDNRRW